MVSLAVVTEYDLGADGLGSATPSVLCPSVVTHTFVPGVLEELVIFSELA